MKSLIRICLGIVVGLGLAACSEAPDRDLSPGLAGAIEFNPDYSVFTELATETGLLRQLESGGPYTVLAPTDIAFKYVGAEALPVLVTPENRTVLTRVLRHHVVEGRMEPEDFVDGMVLTSIDGTSLTVRRIGEVVLVDGATIDLEDSREAENGVVYPASNVIRTNLTAQERVELAPTLSVFTRLARQVDALSDANAEGGVTLLVPMDDAFFSIDGTRERMEAPGNADVLQVVMKTHVISGRLDLDSMPTGSTIQTSGGNTLTIINENGVVSVDGIRVLRAGIDTADGRIYLMGGVLFKDLTLAERFRIQPGLSSFSNEMRQDEDVWERLQDDAENLTVFAPIDRPYVRRSGDLVSALLQPENEVLRRRTRRVLVVEGRYTPRDLTSESRLVLDALDGSRLPVLKGDGRIFVGGQIVSFTGSEMTNGVLYTMNDFIYPQVDLFDSALLMGYTVFTATVRRVGMEEYYRTTPLTIFPPNNSAFRELAITDRSPGIIDILRFHTSEQVHSVQDRRSTIFVMQTGHTREIVEIEVEPRSPVSFLDGVARVLSEKFSFDGMGYVVGVDSLMLPPSEITRTAWNSEPSPQSR